MESTFFYLFINIFCLFSHLSSAHSENILQKSTITKGAEAMYKDYYRLTEEPFRITPDPRFIYMTIQHAEALNHLLYGIYQKKGIICLTGEVGTGKTTLTRNLMDRLDNDPRCKAARILNPALTQTQLLRAVADEFGLDTHKRDRLGLLKVINNFLLDAKSKDEIATIIIDEAQNLPEDSLEMTRMLSNLETATDKLLQIVLVGQPELRDVLDAPRFSQLSQRISVRFHLSAMSASDTEEYIRHRLAVAGLADEQDCPITFDRGAFREIYRFSHGTPRLVNVIGDKALLAGYVKKTGKINKRIVRSAVRELKGIPS